MAVDNFTHSYPFTITRGKLYCFTWTN